MIGIDLVKIDRIEKIINKFGQKGLEKFLNSNEIALSKQKAQTIAGFYAVKEAFAKALKVGIGKDCSFFDIQIKKDQRNAPYLEINQKLIEKFNIKDVSISITHDGGFAIAVCAIENNKLGEV